MKQYTDQGKVDTRSGFGKGRRGAKALLACGVFLFVLMPNVCSCVDLFHQDNMFVLEYRVNEGEIIVVEYPSTGLYRADWSYSSWPIFSYSPPPERYFDEDYLPPPSDSLARFYLSISGYTVGLSFGLRSDTCFFFDGETYYMSNCDSLAIYNMDDGSIRSIGPCHLETIGFPECRNSYLLRDKSWVRFHLSEYASKWFSLEFEYVMLKSEEDDSEPTSIKGFLDIYKNSNSLYKINNQLFEKPILRKRDYEG
ncbi:MAG: hypothetical protein J5695_07970 [Bacteroidales bacterium]|nr:hypothetical protein [Bacteroidales bacterium]